MRDDGSNKRWDNLPWNHQDLVLLPSGAGVTLGRQNLREKVISLIADHGWWEAGWATMSLTLSFKTKDPFDVRVGDRDMRVQGVVSQRCGEDPRLQRYVTLIRWLHRL